MIKNGLKEETALAALTTIPAAQFGLSKSMGTVEAGKLANLVVTDKSYFDEKSAVRYVFVEGNLFEYEAKKKAKKKKAGDGKAVVNIVGEWTSKISVPGQSGDGKMTFTKDGDGYKGTLSSDQSEEDLEVTDIELDGNTLTFKGSVDAGGQQMALEFNLTVNGNEMEGSVTVGEFGTFDVEAEKIDPKF